MRVNKEKLEKLAALPDNELWAEIVKVGEAHGFKLPKNAPPHAELQRLRETVTGSRLELGEAMRILNGYKRSGGR